MRRFWIAILTVTLISHLPFAAAVHHVLARAGVPYAWLFAAFFAALGVALLRGRLRRLRRDAPLPRWKAWLVEEPWYAHWCATIAAWPPLVIAVIGVLIHAAVTGAAGLSSRLGAAALGAYAGALLITTYGVAVRRRWLRVRTIDVPVIGLGAAFDGYRIAHLSDLHIGGLWPRSSAETWIRRVASLDVDLVALTGDYVTHGNAFHADVADVLSAMRGRDGVIAVMGNHDYFGDGEQLVDRIRARGVTMLRNDHLTIARGADAITIAGIDDTWSRRADVRRALMGAKEGQPIIALAHDPQLFPSSRAKALSSCSADTRTGVSSQSHSCRRASTSRVCRIASTPAATAQATPSFM
ncbi:Phosphoesterase [Minicystis rosea]|nr:Phosphoesterase [Minicystis rosea]